jgi:hypothetical protein
MSKHSQARQERRLAQRQRRLPFRPCLEVLEDRVLLSGAMLTVTTLSDPASPTANDGSLRGELLQNQKDGGGDTIVFASGLSGTIHLGSTLSITKSVTIANPNGDTITINGGGKVQDLSVSGSGTDVSITGTSTAGAGSLTFTDGLATSTGTNSGVTGNGGAIAVASGATLNLANLTVSGSTASATATASASADANGGGIWNAGTLTLSGVTVSGNIAMVGGTAGGSDAVGGGIFNTGQLAITGGSVTGNAALNTVTGSASPFALGGGIANGGTLTISGAGATPAAIADNTLHCTAGIANGGGIYNNSDGPGTGMLTIGTANISGNAVTGTFANGGGIDNNGILTLTSSTVAGNTVTGTENQPGVQSLSVGGGIANDNGDVLTATNDTIWNNAVTEQPNGDSNVLYGGGFFLSADSQSTLINDTVGDNTLALTGPGFPDAGIGMEGGGIGTAGTLDLVNTLVSDPNGPLASEDLFTQTNSSTSAQNDVFGSGDGYTFTNNLGGNVVQANIRTVLGPLTNNGGLTPTVALLGISGPGLNHDGAIGGGTTTSTLGTVPTLDQRGDPRPGPNGFDVGAFQTESTPPTPSPMPTTAPATTTVVSVVSDSFGLGPFFSPQTEQVKVTVTSGGQPVNIGSVTIGDGGQQQTVPVSNGSASATFTFKLPQESSTAMPHAVTATYSDNAAGTVFAPSMGSTQSGTNYIVYEWGLFIDILIAAVFGL